MSREPIKEMPHTAAEIRLSRQSKNCKLITGLSMARSHGRVLNPLVKVQTEQANQPTQGDS
ncbi:hypothetical protein GCM10025751_56000 [Haladaptatus pallidirubidus]|uniref:Uncharacterized protein n=1 Tax=Haladaptatus pallidirubidus TaxID=1008152 RepID=A0AAV3URG1_9EURY